YERTSFIQPRIAGSRDRYSTLTSTPPSPGSVTGSSLNCQLSRVGRPTGRFARRIWWLTSEVMAGMDDSVSSADFAAIRRTDEGEDRHAGPAVRGWRECP